MVRYHLAQVKSEVSFCPNMTQRIVFLVLLRLSEIYNILGRFEDELRVVKEALSLAESARGSGITLADCQ